MRTPARRAAVAVLATAAALGGLAAAAEKGGPALPRDFRGWRHVQSIAVTDPDHGMYGFHDGYANEAALRGLRSRERPPRYADGATFVVSIFEIESRNGLTAAGAKRRDVVQVKDRTATATGGWRFAAFDPSGRPIPVNERDCFGCHAGAPERDFVLTSLRE